MFKIGEFSKLSNITIKMLRHYDEIGLLKADKVDENTNYRYYSANQLEKASKITVYKELGFSLKKIKNLIENEHKEEELLSYYKIRIEEIKEEQEKLEKQIHKLEIVSDANKNLNMINYNVVEKTIPQRRIISLRKKIPTYYDEGILWNEIYEIITKNNIKPIYDGYTMAIYHDDEYKEEDIDIEIQVTVEDKEDYDDVKFIRTEEQKVVSVTFSGSYEQMPKVAEAVAYYIEENNLSLTGKMVNIFHVSPAQTKNEEEYVTEACYFIK
ncbi:MerR family transcriptional regulator [Miniphocaeibacter halophilus]|uniref:MerR family transcriptional regulator n=1 Tax=Miniphocaeibacter halophilus TaxID=2931922 RepID=A0AC61MT50_9FIRM|nr:MerR family transcriptional regulator [Miniphocaeibacter halophilus]QQK07406.1 MerR family transcriptional regulator [Miniphocaeibacter halophilus]